VIRGCKPRLAKVEGITLYMQPVQDLTVEDRVSRTQFQYSLEDADPRNLAIGPGWWPNCKTLPELRDVATDQQNQAACRPIWSSTATPHPAWA
jgi:multidrug efflux pump